MQPIEPIEIDEEFKEKAREATRVREDESGWEASKRNPAIFMEKMLGIEPYWWQKHFLTQVGKGVRGEKDTRTYVALTSRQIGKAQPYDEPVLTPNGWVEMGELEVGDEVIAEDGSPTRVTEIFEQGVCDTFEVTFTDGSSTRCNKEHLWKYKGHGAKHWRTGSLQDILDRKGGYTPTSDQGVRIPITEKVEFPEKSHDIHPYTFGAFLGDGSLKNVSFSQKNDDVVNNINDADGIITLDEGQGVNEWLVRPGKRAQHIFSEYNLRVTSENKFIPDDYLYDSVKNRKALLAGLMDTDGSIYGKCQMEYYSVSKQLAEDVRELVQSLGGTAEICEKPSWYKDGQGNKKHCKLCYRVKITFYDYNPFWIDRKADKWYPIKYNRTRILDSVEHVGKDKQRCIKVDHPSSTYITDDYIVTHNSTSLAVIGLWTCLFNHDSFGSHNTTKVGSFSMSDTQAKKLMYEVKHMIRSGDYHMQQEHGVEDFFSGLIDENEPNNKTQITFEAHDPALHQHVLNGARIGPSIRTYPPTNSVLGETFSTAFIDEAGQVSDEFYEDIFTPTMNAANGVRVITSTPWSGSGFYWELIKNRDELDVEVFAFDVEALAEEENNEQAERQLQSVNDTIDDLEARGKHDTIQRQYYCEFVQGTNQYFDPDVVNDIFTESLEKQLPEEKPVDVGIDFGGSASSHTVVTLSHWNEDKDRVERVWHKRYDVNEDLNLLKDLKRLNKVCNVNRWIPEECPQADYYIQKMEKELGWNVTPFKPSRNKASAYSAFDNFLRSGQVFSYPDNDLKEEMKALVREETRRTTRIHAPRNYTDDMIDSFVISSYHFVQGNNEGRTKSYFGEL